MNTPRDNDKTSLEFRLAMVQKLNANNHKKHWNLASMRYLIGRLKDELSELESAMKFLETFGDYPSSDVMEECADVANFAMMIWDNARHGIIGGSEDGKKMEGEKKC